MKQYIFSSALGLLILGFFQFFTLTPFDQTLRVYFLDVGQGDATLIRYPTGEYLLIDTGKDSRIFRELDKVLPWYNKKIDSVLITHGDLDHAGAMLDILGRYSVSTIFVSEFFGEIELEKEIINKAQKKDVSVEILKIGTTLTFGASIQNSFSILHPDPTCFIVYQNENDCSLVALLEYGDHAFLFTGDIGKKVEQELIQVIAEPVTFLKVSHHGSRFSTDEEFIQKIKPTYSIMSVGENSYGHPHPDVLATLARADSIVWSTKEAATIVAASNGTSIEVKKLFDQASFFQSSVCSILLYGFDTSC